MKIVFIRLNMFEHIGTDAMKPILFTIIRHLTPDELTEISFDCRQRFNSVGSIISRAMEPRTNLRTPYRFMTYLLYNPLFRKEAFKKQGLRFGLKDGKGVTT